MSGPSSLMIPTNAAPELVAALIEVERWVNDLFRRPAPLPPFNSTDRPDATKWPYSLVYDKDTGVPAHSNGVVWAEITSGVPTSRQVIAGTGLSGGGALTADVTVNLANTAVTPAAYVSANITIDQQGRITAASNGSSFDEGQADLNAGVFAL